MIDQLSNDMYENSTTKLDKIIPKEPLPPTVQKMNKFESIVNNDGSLDTKRSNSEPQAPKVHNEQLMVRRQGVSNPPQQEKKRVDWINSPRISQMSAFPDRFNPEDYYDRYESRRSQ